MHKPFIITPRNIVNSGRVGYNIVAEAARLSLFLEIA